jgi:glycosyltransferase involved in cell wall biosynthesis
MSVVFHSAGRLSSDPVSAMAPPPAAAVPGAPARDQADAARVRHLLFYVPSLSGGGAERVWALVASRLAERGYRVTFATDFADADNAAFLHPNVRQVTLGTDHGDAVRALRRLLRTERPDASLSALSSTNLKHLAAAILAGRRRRAILSYHGYAASEPKRLSFLGYVLTPVLSRLAGRTVTVSYGLRRYLIDRWFASARKLELIYNPIPVDRITTPTAEALAARPPVILGMGRLVDYKGFDTLIRALALMTTPGARLVILGEGEDRARLEALVNALGLSARVSMPGYAPAPWEAYAGAKVFALSSQTEAFGNVVVEAMAAGLPVVSTRCHGPEEIMVFGRYGDLVPVGDALAMAAALDRALAAPGDPVERRQRAEAFALDAAVDNYERLIHHVIGRAEGTLT